MKEWEKAWVEWYDSVPRLWTPKGGFSAGWDEAIDFIIQNVKGYVEGSHNQEDMVIRIKASLEGKEEWWKNL